jgi:hypothetical protein
MATVIEKKTAERMLKNIDMRLQQLSMEQQSMNGNNGAGNMRKGGIVRQKMRKDGLVLAPKQNPNRTKNYEDWVREQNLFQQSGINPYNYAFKDRGQTPGNYEDWARAQGIPGMLDPNAAAYSAPRYNTPQQGVQTGMPNDGGYWMGKVGNIPYPQGRAPKGVFPGATGKPLLDYQIPQAEQPFNMATDPRFGPFSNVPEAQNAVAGKGLPSTTPSTTTPTAITDANVAKMNASIGKALPKPSLGMNIPNKTFDFSQGQALVGETNPAAVTPEGFNYNNLMGLAPMAFNAIAGLTSGQADVLRAQDYQNPYADQAFANMPDQFRIDNILNDNRNAYATHNRNINQMGNSRGERMANYGAGMNRMNESNTAAWALKNNQENQLRTNKWNMRNQQGQQVAETNLNVRNMNDQNAAAARNRQMGYLGAAASGLQQYGLTQQQMGNQMKNENRYMDILAGSLGSQGRAWLGMGQQGSVPNGVQSPSRIGQPQMGRAGSNVNLNRPIGSTVTQQPSPAPQQQTLYNNYQPDASYSNNMAGREMVGQDYLTMPTRQPAPPMATADPNWDAKAGAGLIYNNDSLYGSGTFLRPGPAKQYPIDPEYARQMAGRGYRIGGFIKKNKKK